tara:strand:- start:901 stop:1104 length:204 start_codon:yes stop_codon:yes gene_type:complete
MIEIEQLRQAIDALEQKISDLQKENHSLRESVVSACNSLTKHNHQMSQHVSMLNKNFKKPRWTRVKE